MSSFTHYLEEQVLNDYIKTDGIYFGLSRENGNRRGLFATWEEVEGEYEITEEGIDEPGEGWFYDEEEETWKQESDEGLADSYQRMPVGAEDWHDVEIVLGEDGESELRLVSDIEFPEAGEDEDWGQITHFFLVDTDTVGEGNILAFGQMPDEEQITEGDVAKIWANTIVIRMTE